MILIAPEDLDEAVAAMRQLGAWAAASARSLKMDRVEETLVVLRLKHAFDDAYRAAGRAHKKKPPRPIIDSDDVDDFGGQN